MAIFNSYVKLPEGTVAPSEFCGPKHPPQPGRRSKRYCFRSHSSPPVASLSSLGGGKCHEKPHCDLKRNNWKGHSYHVLSRILRKCIFLSFLLGTIHLYVLWHWWFDKPPIYGNVADGVLLGCQRYETIPIGLMLGNFSGNFLMVICYNYNVFFCTLFVELEKYHETYVESGWNMMKPEALRQHLFQLVSRPIWQQRPEQIRVDEASLRLQRQFQ